MSAKNSSKAADVREETTVKPTAPSAKAVPDKKGNLVYMGPTIVGIVRHATVFKAGDLPEKAKECVAEFPAMGRLFVEIDRLPDAARELKKKQSALSALYLQTMEKFRR